MNRRTLAFAGDDNSPFPALAHTVGRDGVRSLDLRPRRDHTCARRGAEGAAS